MKNAKKEGGAWIWTRDFLTCSQILYPWALPPQPVAAIFLVHLWWLNTNSSHPLWNSCKLCILKLYPFCICNLLWFFSWPPIKGGGTWELTRWKLAEKETDTALVEKALTNTILLCHDPQLQISPCSSPASWWVEGGKEEEDISSFGWGDPEKWGTSQDNQQSLWPRCLLCSWWKQ